MSLTKKFTRNVPIKIKEELDKIDYPRKDNLYTIIDHIYRREIYFKSELQKNYGYVEIPLVAFKNLIASSDNLQSDLNFLIEDLQVIMRNNFFVIGQKSKSYKIASEYMGKTVAVEIQNKNINKKIAEQIKRAKSWKVKNLEFAKSEYFKTFRIDVAGANKAILDKTVLELIDLSKKVDVNLSKQEVIDIIECKHQLDKNRALLMIANRNEMLNILHRYMVYTTRINAINEGFLFFKRNSTNGRLDSNLTSLPSFLRPFIISTEKLKHIDIKNSQPYFLYTVLMNSSDIEPSELKRYGELVITGKLYEFLLDEYIKQTGYLRTRDQMKKMLFKIFYSKTTSFKMQKDFFAKQFPTIMQYINKVNAKEHNTLSVMLQTRESYAILDIIMPLLEQKGIRPYTIHDSFLCKENEANTVVDIFNNKLVEMFGIAPALHVEYLAELEPENENENNEWDDEFFTKSSELYNEDEIDKPIQIVHLPKATKEQLEELLGKSLYSNKP